jgi:hypothetical protein
VCAHLWHDDTVQRETCAMVPHVPGVHADNVPLCHNAVIDCVLLKECTVTLTVLVISCSRHVFFPEKRSGRAHVLIHYTHYTGMEC